MARKPHPIRIPSKGAMCEYKQQGDLPGLDCPNEATRVVEGRAGVQLLCETHADYVLDHDLKNAEYYPQCPNCGCEFGYG